MLNHLSDFYRIVHPEPSDGFVTQRKEGVGLFIEKLSDREIRCASVDIAVFGLPTDPNVRHSNAAGAIVASIQQSQPSFPSDIAANPMDLRILAGIALGEYVSKSDDIGTASIISSALATRPLPNERYLAAFSSALLGTAQECLRKAANKLRQRPELSVEAVQGADFPTLTKSINNVLDRLRKDADQNLRVDREELDILWYVFGANSTTLAKSLRDLEVSQRCFASALELAQLVIIPPAAGSVQFLEAAINEQLQLTLRKLIEPCPVALLRMMNEGDSILSDLLGYHPALLPITWLSKRRLDSGLAAGWEPEFQVKTRLSPDDVRDASIWAEQIFNERVATRLLAEDEQSD